MSLAFFPAASSSPQQSDNNSLPLHALDHPLDLCFLIAQADVQTTDRDIRAAERRAQ
jgi:hypothetical protein